MPVDGTLPPTAMSSLLVILARTASELDWRRVSELLINHHSLAQQAEVLVYMPTNSDESTTTTKLVVFLCFYSLDSSKMLNEKSDISPVLAPLAGTFEYRLYQPLHPFSKPIHTGNHIAIMNAMTPDPNAEKRFNDWYTEEHIPLLRLIPSWISSDRYQLVSATASHVPHYLALHNLNNLTAFDTEEYRAATTTPWRTEVIAKIVEKERLVLDFVGELDSLVAKVSGAP